jgi:hypothetical protein
LKPMQIIDAQVHVSEHDDVQRHVDWESMGLPQDLNSSVLAEVDGDEMVTSLHRAEVCPGRPASGRPPRLSPQRF